MTNIYLGDERPLSFLNKHYYLKFKPKVLYIGEFNEKGKFDLKEHAHEFCEIIFVTDGELDILIEGNHHTVSKGEVLILNANTMHWITQENNQIAKIKLFALDEFKIKDFPSNCLIENGDRFIFQLGKYEKPIQKSLDYMFSEYENKEPYYFELIQYIASSILMMIFRIILVDEDNEESIQGNRIVDKAVAYIRKNYMNDIGLESISETLYINKYYLSRIFSMVTGTGINNYINNVRIYESKKLLKNTRLSIDEITHCVGFSNSNYFCRVFKKITNITPSQYRRNNDD